MKKHGYQDKVELYQMQFNELIECKLKDKVHIVYLDPPNKTNYAIDSIKLLIKNEILKSDSIIIIETDQKEEMKGQLENLDMLDNSLNTTILTMDYLMALEKLYPKKFDIIFLDPPYKTDYIAKALDKISNLNMLNPLGIVVLESDSLEKLDYNSYYEEVKTKKYGDKYIRIVKKKD